MWCEESVRWRNETDEPKLPAHTLTMASGLSGAKDSDDDSDVRFCGEGPRAHSGKDENLMHALRCSCNCSLAWNQSPLRAR